MLSKFKSLVIETIAAQVVEGTERELITLNQNQLFHGEDADGNKLPRYRSERRARIKNSMNPLPGYGIPDYYVTGRMYNQMYVDFERDGTYKIRSNVPYFGVLTARGGNPFGIQPNNKVQYIKNTFKGRFIKIIANIVGVKVA